MTRFSGGWNAHGTLLASRFPEGNIGSSAADIAKSLCFLARQEEEEGLLAAAILSPLPAPFVGLGSSPVFCPADRGRTAYRCKHRSSQRGALVHARETACIAPSAGASEDPPPKAAGVLSERVEPCLARVAPIGGPPPSAALRARWGTIGDRTRAQECPLTFSLRRGGMPVYSLWVGNGPDAG